MSFGEDGWERLQHCSSSLTDSASGRSEWDPRVLRVDACAQTAASSCMALVRVHSVQVTRLRSIQRVYIARWMRSPLAEVGEGIGGRRQRMERQLGHALLERRQLLRKSLAVASIQHPADARHETGQRLRPGQWDTIVSGGHNRVSEHPASTGTRVGTRMPWSSLRRASAAGTARARPCRP